MVVPIYSLTSGIEEFPLFHLPPTLDSFRPTFQPTLRALILTVLLHESLIPAKFQHTLIPECIV